MLTPTTQRPAWCSPGRREAVSRKPLAYTANVTSSSTGATAPMKWFKSGPPGHRYWKPSPSSVRKSRVPLST